MKDEEALTERREAAPRHWDSLRSQKAQRSGGRRGESVPDARRDTRARLVPVNPCRRPWSISPRTPVQAVAQMHATERQATRRASAGVGTGATWWPDKSLIRKGWCLSCFLWAVLGRLQPSADGGCLYPHPPAFLPAMRPTPLPFSLPFFSSPLPFFSSPLRLSQVLQGFAFRLQNAALVSHCCASDCQHASEARLPCWRWRLMILMLFRRWRGAWASSSTTSSSTKSRVSKTCRGTYPGYIIDGNASSGQPFSRPLLLRFSSLLCNDFYGKYTRALTYENFW